MKGHLVRRDALLPAQRKAMLALLLEHFDGVTEEVFARDLAEKNWVVLVEDRHGRLAGFSTLLYYHASHDGRTLGVVCSGDTIVARRARHSRALLATWLEAVLGLGRDVASDCLYWLLLSSGYRTYRFLPVCFEKFFPAREPMKAPELGPLANRLAAERWGRCYDPRSGLVRFPQPQRLKAGVSPLSSRLLRDHHIAFFVERTPGHADGDELVCLVPLRRDNLTGAGRRLLVFRNTGASLTPEVHS